MKPLGRNNYAMTRDVTWSDIKACVDKLSAFSNSAGESEEFAPLHRVEGGFMCVEGPEFETTETWDSKAVDQTASRACARPSASTRLNHI